MKSSNLKVLFLFVGSLLYLSVLEAQTISGELKKWHKVSITFDGPFANEADSFNPFLNYRLEVTFTHTSGKTYKVPGYFAADGKASETGATSGNKWRVHFAPDELGSWRYTVSFRKGASIAVSDVSNEGTAVTPINGLAASFIIGASDKTGRDLRRKGRLNYVGSSLLQFAETGEYFRKAGADSPENLLAYNDFDNTGNYNNYRKSWSPHVQDWTSNDPTWKGGKGKGLIGAINYLALQGMNSISFLTMNINGDDRNVYPYVSPTSLSRIDVSKVSQWEIVFVHADKMGMHLHFKTQEAENSNLLDSGNTGRLRKLYYRELIARFSHHLALNWNLGEENSQNTQQQKAMAQYIHDHDPYKHNIVLHTRPGLQEIIYRPLLGTASQLTGVSIQTDTSNVHAETKKWVLASSSANKKWIVANDEQNPATVGVAADAEYTGNRGSIADNSEKIRKAVLWGNFMAGGAGVEYYFGKSTGETDLTCQDFRSRAKSWRYAKYAVIFFNTHLPKTALKPLSNVSRGWVAGKDGEVYVVYLKNGGSSTISLPGTAIYSIGWYNPRTGGGLQTGTIATITGGGTRSIGNPPSTTTSDWVALIKITNGSNIVSYQAENHTAQNGTTTSSTFPGFTGTGYSDYGGNGSFIEWNNVKGNENATTLKFYYSNGSSGNRQCAIIINGINVGTVAFASTGSWSTWQTATITASLPNSLNKVRVIANTSSGGPNLDKMEVKFDITAANKGINPLTTSILNIYPNPARESLNILSSNGGVINIYNIHGSRIYSNRNARNLEIVSLNNFSDGVYIVELVSDNKKVSKQFIKMK